MSDTLLASLLTALGTLAVVGVAGFFLIARGYRLSPKGIKLPFMEFDASRFGDLSPVRLFANVSRFVITPSKNAQHWLDGSDVEITPIMLIHVGWQVVSNAYVKRFMAYPTEADLSKQISELGPQNIEFILMFQKIYNASIRFNDNVKLDFAREYFLRAPSLAIRISGTSTEDQTILFQEIARLLPESEDA